MKANAASPAAAENAVLNPSNPVDPAAAERESAPAEISSAASDSTEGHPSDSEEAGKPALRKGKGKRGSVRKPVLIPDEAHPNLIYGKPFDGEIRPIADLLPEGEPSAVLHGEVFLSEAVPMKNNEKTILSFAITDYTDSIRA